VDSVGYRAVRSFRRKLMAQLTAVLVSPCKQFKEDFTVAGFPRAESAVWQLVSQRPEHLIDPRFDSWDKLLLAAADEVAAEATAGGAKLADFNWGRYNMSRIQHPLSMAVPRLGGWLDMPARAQDGDSSNMPRIQSPMHGASQRMAVSPGHEED